MAEITKQDEQELEGRRGDIPPAVWEQIQKNGAKAVDRLGELLDSAGFKRLKASEQAKLIELAMNRAYGPPVQRTATLQLTGKVSDAVSDELARLSQADLPENKR